MGERAKQFWTITGAIIAAALIMGIIAKVV